MKEHFSALIFFFFFFFTKRTVFCISANLYMCSRCLKFSNLPNFKRGDNGTESAWLKMTLSPLRVLPSAFYSLPSVQRWRLSFYLSQKLFSHFCLFLIFSPLCFNPSELICGKKNFSCSNSTLFFFCNPKDIVICTCGTKHWKKLF